MGIYCNYTDYTMLSGKVNRFSYEMPAGRKTIYLTDGAIRVMMANNEKTGRMSKGC